MNKIDFGIDAPKDTAALFRIAGILLLIYILSFFIYIPSNLLVNLVRILSLLFFCCFLITGLLLILSSKIFKYKNRDKIIQGLALKGSENILDIGCGRGLYTIGFAEQLSTGKVYGIDIWNAEDMSNNTENSILENIQKAGLEEKIIIKTEDMRAMSFEDEYFDIIIASFSIHNIGNIPEIQKALHEIARVTKKDGKIVIIDFKYINEYKYYLLKNNFKIVQDTRAKGLFPIARNLIFKKM